MVIDMTKKQLLWGYPYGSMAGSPKRNPPTHERRGVVWVYFPAGLSPMIQSKYGFVKKKAPDCLTFIFIVDL